MLPDRQLQSDWWLLRNTVDASLPVGSIQAVLCLLYIFSSMNCTLRHTLGCSSQTMPHTKTIPLLCHCDFRPQNLPLSHIPWHFYDITTNLPLPHIPWHSYDIITANEPHPNISPSSIGPSVFASPSLSPPRLGLLLSLFYPISSLHCTGKIWVPHWSQHTHTHHTHTNTHTHNHKDRRRSSPLPMGKRLHW